MCAYARTSESTVINPENPMIVHRPASVLAAREQDTERKKGEQPVSKNLNVLATIPWMLAKHRPIANIGG